MRDTFEEKAACWRERLQDCLKKGKLSPNKFVELYNEHFNDGKAEKAINRNTFYRWRNVGLQNKPGQKIGFPRYENMLRTAQLLGVDVGYLTGETDEDTFTLKEASEYLNLDAKAIKVIRKLTGAMEWNYTKEETKIKERYKISKTESDKFKTAFVLMITAKYFLPFMIDFVEFMDRSNCQDLFKEKEAEDDIDTFIADYLKDLPIDLMLERLGIDDIEKLTKSIESYYQQNKPSMILEFQNQKKRIKFSMMENLILLLNEIFPEDD